MAEPLAATPAGAPVGLDHDYVADVASLQSFLTGYEARDEHFELRHKYMDVLQRVSDREETVVRLSLDDLADHDDALAAKVLGNTWRYLDLAATAIDAVLPRPSEGADLVEDVLDVLVRQRRTLHAEAAPGVIIPDAANQLPPSLLRRWHVVFEPSSKSKAVPMREVRSAQIGKLLQIKGIVTRVTDVKPRMSIVTYTCDTCGNEVYQEVSGITFMPLADCISERCRTNQSKGKLHLETRGSRFTAYQELKIQEHAGDVPVGHTPRQITIHARGALTRQCTAGDVVTIGGVFLPTPMAARMRAGLIADVYVEAMKISKEKKGYGEMIVDDELREDMRAAVAEGGMYDKLARSIAPEIYGLEDIKKALLLQLVGGVTRTMKDGMKIRGDINICLVGDPGVAKSQLLKHVATVAPRGVYTSGKGASGVGLTAAVLRDPLTQDFVLEGGALVLADNGICCIDEFDKMEDSDRTAIHEVMEQQTVSIAKAGINTTLNARTAVLAAANPVLGRYDPRRSILFNVNLPAALLSRFDLLYLLLDRADLDRDRQLAEHILTVHRTLAPPAGAPGSRILSSFTGRGGSRPRDATGGAGGAGGAGAGGAGGRRRRRSGRKVGGSSGGAGSDDDDDSGDGNGGDGDGSDGGDDDDDTAVLEPKFIRAFIAEARRHEPSIPASLAPHIVAAYAALRSRDKTSSSDDTHTTPRTLLSILRLSQAVARISLRSEVAHRDFEEAVRLMRDSKSSVEDAGAAAGPSRAPAGIDACWQAITELRRSMGEGVAELAVADVVAHVARRSITREIVEECLERNSELNLIVVTGRGSSRKIRFVQSMGAGR
jgi:DNA replication licensing factor MCM7